MLIHIISEQCSHSSKHLWVVGYTSVFLQNRQHSSLYLSELVKAFVKFHLLSPRTSPQPRITPLSHHPILRNGIFPPIAVFVTISFPCFCTLRTNPSSGADPNITMSRAAICVLTGSAGGTLWIAAKAIHSHGVPHTPMLFHSFILETRRNGLIHHRWNSCKYFLVLFKEGSWCIICSAT